MKRVIFLLFFFCFVFSSSFALELEITKQYEEDLIQRVQNVYTNKTPIYPLPKCGTSVMLELNMVKEKLSPETRELLKPYLSRPSLSYTYNTPRGHFKIHYDKTGANAVYNPSEDVNPVNGIPDYVDRCAEALDYVWAKEVDTMGYNQPPSDGSAGGDSKYDVYIVNLGYGYLGVTYSESPTTPTWSYTSYIELANYYTGYGYPNQYDLMHVTVGHELFHSIQFGYDIFEGYDPYPNWKPYWMEMSSTWMEDQTYDNVNDYVGYLSYFFNYPWVSLKAFSSDFSLRPVRAYHPYASCVFPIFLSEKFGVGVMKNIWTECGRIPYNNTFAAIDTALKPFGADFDSAFKEFLVWNIFTGTRAEPSKYYSEGSLYDTINILNQQRYSAYPVNVTSVDSMPENLASNYVRFTPLAGPGGLAMIFDGTSIAQWVVPIVGYKSGGAHLISAFDLNAQQEGSFDFYNWDDYNYIYMIAGVLTKDSSKYNYGYADTFKVGLGVDQDNLPDRGEYALAQNYPNPFNSQTTLYYNLKEDGIVNISIYNILGQKIRELCNNFQRIGANRISWDGKDDQNRDLSSGIYFYRIKTKNFELTKRMVLLK